MGKRFSFDTVEDFDDHIEASIFGFDIIDNVLVSLSGLFIEPNTNVYDLGCSTGRLLGRLSIGNHIPNISYVGYEKSKNLIPEVTREDVQLYQRDITEPAIKFFNTNLIYSIFTLQFIERNKRTVLIQKVFDSLNKGGCFIVAEKVRAESGVAESILNRTHIEYKRLSFSSAEILDKDYDLRTILRPITQKQNEDEFRRIGFTTVEVFWKSLNFVSWILIK